MPALLEEPDFETLAVQWLKSRDALTALVPAASIGTKLSGTWKAGDAALRIRRIGGLPTETRTGAVARGRLQVEAFAVDEDLANRIATRADLELRLLPELEPVRTIELDDPEENYDVAVSSVSKDLPIANNPDPDSDSARYLFGTVLIARRRAA